MRKFYLLKLIVVWLLLLSEVVQGQRTMVATGQQAKPWTYWWWMGSAVNEPDITHQLEQFAKAGLGGVHIIPIYGVKGYESQFIPFLSDRWLDVFAHTVREGKRLGVGVDLTTGTGWPFGGPNISDDMVAKAWKLDNGTLTAVPTGQQVKRPAPGGAGSVIDYFSSNAVRDYLRKFDSTLVRSAARPRAVYNDSYEVYGANWTANFLAEFKNRRGYELTSQLTAFLDTTQTQQNRPPATILVQQDFHQTLSELLLSGFAKTWGSWAQHVGYLTRNQAHGSPGNLIDLYAQADIPETESFGSSRFPIPGLRVDTNYEVDRFGTPHPLAMKFASSAANLMGKPLVSSETGTWLANHFQVSLSQIKPQVDELFASGINHIFYHGIPYSPPAEPWPGWQFYASTNYSPSSHFWPYLPLLNSYIERCQTRLQASKPDNDILLYFPIHDLWATRAKSAGGIHQLEVHHVDQWLLPQPFGQLGEHLLHQGYSFDCISDELLNGLRIDKQGIHSADGATYRAILVPRTTYIPEKAMYALNRLAREGAHIVFESQFPQQATGFYRHEPRSEEVKQLGDKLRQQATVKVSTDVFNTLDSLGVRAESWAAEGLSFLRKRQGNTTQYFITNLSNQFRQNWIRLSATGRISRYDPLTNRAEILPVRKNKTKHNEVFLALAPGQSCFLDVSPGTAAVANANYQKKATDYSKAKPIPLKKPWQVQFLSGRPALTNAATLPALTSWTTLSDSAGYYWGTARYSTTFDLPAGASANSFRLDLGDVREVATVRLNGQPLGTVWCLPFQLIIPASQVKPRGNKLEVEVTNLSANYMRLYDRLHPEWKKFYDINIVDIRYKPFDATHWETVPSGLLGPVTLTPDSSLR
jgi:hypothetical protein